DATTEARIRTALREVMRGRTTIIIAHRLSTIALADELVVLSAGRIAARGTHDELIESSPVYRDIYEHGLLEREFAERVEARGGEGAAGGSGSPGAPGRGSAARRCATGRGGGRPAV